MSEICIRNLSILFLIIVFAPRIAQKKTPKVTLSVQERVNLLKFQIAEQINHQNPELITPVNDNDEYQYVDVRSRPRTPINEFDERKKDEKFRLPEIVTKPTSPSSGTPTEPQGKPIGRMKKKNRGRRRKKMKHLIKPVDTFYRRIYKEDFLRSPMRLLHCQDLIDPILTGHRKNYSSYHTGFVRKHDQQVLRITHLLSKNTSIYNSEEITQLLYQVSNLKIRLFEWTIDAIYEFLDFLLKGQPHSWRNIKYAMIDLITIWNLDLSNTTAFLTQARLYRPPCVTTSGYEGSTKTSSGVRYSKLTTSKTTCAVRKGNKCDDKLNDDDDDDDDDDDR